MPERAVDVRLGFFRIADAPHDKVLVLFGIESLSETELSGPGLHQARRGGVPAGGTAPSPHDSGSLRRT